MVVSTVADYLPFECPDLIVDHFFLMKENTGLDNASLRSFVKTSGGT